MNMQLQKQTAEASKHFKKGNQASLVTWEV